MNIFTKIIFTLALFIFFNKSWATAYYADPVTGSMANDGSFSSPWSSLEEIMNEGIGFSAGDTIFLRDGNHGFPKINGHNQDFVEIRPQAGHFPNINRIYIGNLSGTSYWKLSNLQVQSIRDTTYSIFLIEMFPASSNIVIEKCTILSEIDTDMWGRSDWRDKTNHGIRTKGSKHSLIDNDIKNIALGLSIESDSTWIFNNSIQYFTIDGIRMLESNGTYEQNSVKDNIVVFINTENHYDGFQSFTCCPIGSDTIKNVIMRRNLVINCTDPNRQWRGPMQGLGAFDGYFENWTIENNIIITDHWHGITLLGAINCKIVNNTVIDPYDVSPIDPFDPNSKSELGPAWIKIAKHKNGSPSFGNTIRNNLSADLQSNSEVGDIDHNIRIGASSHYPSYFVDIDNYDLHLTASSPAIDSGNSLLAPLNDFDNKQRPKGQEFDIGAYEYNSATGIKEESLKNNVWIYPNPCKSVLNIKTDQLEWKTYTIYDAYGKKVKSDHSPFNASIAIDIEGLSSGIFFIKLAGKNTTSIHKFIKNDH